MKRTLITAVALTAFAASTVAGWATPPAASGVASFKFEGFNGGTSLDDLTLTGAFPTANGTFVGTIRQSHPAYYCAESSDCAQVICHGSRCLVLPGDKVGPFDMSGNSLDGKHSMAGQCNAYETDGGPLTFDPASLGVQMPININLTLTCDLSMDGRAPQHSTMVIASETRGFAHGGIGYYSWTQSGPFAEGPRLTQP